MTAGMWRSGGLSLLAGLVAALCLQAPVDAQTNTGSAKSPIILLPGITASELLGVYSPFQATPAYRDTTRGLNTAAAAFVAGLAGQVQTFDIQLRAITTAISNAARQQQRGGGTLASSLLLPATPPCPVAFNADKLSVWLPLDENFLMFPNCFYHMVALKYNKQQGRFSNNTGAAVSADTGGPSGMEFSLFSVAGYDKLADYITRTFGYTVSKDLFAIPYDWRYDLTTMKQAYQMDKIKQRIASAVKANGGKKAILIGHSMGSLVSLSLLQDPRHEAWRRSNIQGFIALAAPLAGAVRAIGVRAAGVGMDTSDRSVLGDVATWFNVFLHNILYAGTMGLPSPVMLFPYEHAFGADWVVARTPSRSYTVSQQMQLLEDIGDQQAVDFYKRVRNLDTLVPATTTRKRPTGTTTPGVPIYCVYGTTVDTAKTYSFRENFRPGVMASAPSVAVMGKGDGTVNLESLRLCRQLTTSDKITELTDGTDHVAVLTAASAHAAVGRYLRQLLAASG